MAPRTPSGPNDPDNPDAKRNQPKAPPPPPSAADKSNGVWELPQYPGYQITDAAGDDGWSVDDYTAWASGVTKGGWGPWIQAYGDEFQALLYRATIELWDEVKFNNEIAKRGWVAPDTGGGGGRGGGGGGGGATKAQQYAQAGAQIRNMAGMLGLELDQGGIEALARVAVDGNWSNDMLMDYMAPGARDTQKAGMITAGVTQIRALAARQLLNVSEETAREWAVKIASGEMDLDGLRSLFQAQASQRYGWAAAQINQGIDVRDILLPTRDALARELELAPEEVDMMDSKWLSMMQTTDDKTGEVRAATESEVIVRARQDPRWAQTKGASQLVSGLGTMLRDYFGG